MIFPYLRNQNQDLIISEEKCNIFITTVKPKEITWIHFGYKYFGTHFLVFLSILLNEINIKVNWVYIWDEKIQCFKACLKTPTLGTVPPAAPPWVSTIVHDAKRCEAKTVNDRLLPEHLWSSCALPVPTDTAVPTEFCLDQRYLSQQSFCSEPSFLIPPSKAANAPRTD